MLRMCMIEVEVGCTSLLPALPEKGSTLLEVSLYIIYQASWSYCFSSSTFFYVSVLRQHSRVVHAMECEVE